MNTTSIPAPANDNALSATRPAEFDRLLVAYLPSLYSRVRRITKLGRDEIASDAIEMAMRNFKTFDPARGGFYGWLMLQVRSAARDYRVRTQRQWSREVVLDDDSKGYTSAPQIDVVMLGEVLTAANDTNGRAAVLAGMGYSMKEMAQITGHSPAYANNCARAGRLALREMAGLGPLARMAA